MKNCPFVIIQSLAFIQEDWPYQAILEMQTYIHTYYEQRDVDLVSASVMALLQELKASQGKLIQKQPDFGAASSHCLHSHADSTRTKLQWSWIQPRQLG